MRPWLSHSDFGMLPSITTNEILTIVWALSLGNSSTNPSFGSSWSVLALGNPWHAQLHPSKPSANYKRHHWYMRPSFLNKISKWLRPCNHCMLFWTLWRRWSWAYQWSHPPIPVTRFDLFTLVLPAPVGLADGVITLPIKHHGGFSKPFSGSQSCWNAFTAYSRRLVSSWRSGVSDVSIWMQTDPHTVVRMLPWWLRWLKGKASNLTCPGLSVRFHVCYSVWHSRDVLGCQDDILVECPHP